MLEPVGNDKQNDLKNSNIWIELIDLINFLALSSNDEQHTIAVFKFDTYHLLIYVLIFLLELVGNDEQND